MMADPGPLARAGAAAGSGGGAGPARRAPSARWRRFPALLAAAVAVLALAACGGSEATASNDDPGEMAVFVFDRSGSIPNHKLALAQELTGRRLLTLDHGDRIVAMQLLEASLEEPPNRWSQEVPLREFPDERVASDSLARVRFLRDARIYMRRFTDTTTREEVGATDILSTLHDVAADLRAHPDHRTTLYLFSDMLQANRRLNFESPGETPPDGWVKSASEAGTLPDLSGLCVVVVGARVDTRRGQAIKDFWQEYFTATGARLDDHDYGLRPVELPEEPCP